MQSNKRRAAIVATALLAVATAADSDPYPYPPQGPGYRPAPPPSYYRSDPWSEMRRMEREMRRRQWLMEREMRRMEREMESDWRDNSSSVEIHESFSSPRIDIREDTENYIVTARIPGADEKTIEVEQRGNRLRIAAMRQVEKRETSSGRRVRASFSSRYQRILTLPGPVRESGMQTDIAEDLLTIRVPKAD